MGNFLYMLPFLFFMTTADPYEDLDTLPNKQVIVQLFEWKWKDIAEECENFLPYYGYGAVQISPPNEHITLTKNNDMPWWIRYQPVSYKLTSRSGTVVEFVDMVNRCNNAGVRIIADAVINHMVEDGQKKGVDGRDSSGGSFFDATQGKADFPEVPYSVLDFHNCTDDVKPEDIKSNPQRVRDCRLHQLLDLDQSRSYVQQKIIDYLNHLVDIGVAGFNINAATYMRPHDLQSIQERVKDLREDIFGTNKRPFFAHEVDVMGNISIQCSEYTELGRCVNYPYGLIVSRAARGYYSWDKLQELGPGYFYGYRHSANNDALVFIDNPTTQRENWEIMTYKNNTDIRHQRYNYAVAFMLAWPYGVPRVMSGYYFDNEDQGPPNGGPAGGYETKSPTFNEDLTCDDSSGFVCEHRLPVIREMAKFRSVVNGAEVTEIVEKFRALAFARKGKGFFAITESLVSFTRVYQTTLPGGEYCDVWSGYLKDGICTGKSITVESDGTAEIDVFPVVAISLASKIDTPRTETAIPSQTSRLTTHHPQSTGTSSASHPTQTVTQTTPTQSSNSKRLHLLHFIIFIFALNMPIRDL